MSAPKITLGQNLFKLSIMCRKTFEGLSHTGSFGQVDTIWFSIVSLKQLVTNYNSCAYDFLVKTVLGEYYRMN